MALPVESNIKGEAVYESVHRVVCAGFGGQGVMSLGLLMTYAGMHDGNEVSWLPSYGPEMRGGTANCHVTISRDKVASPVISSDADVLIAMNLPSLEKFEGMIRTGGVLIANSSMIPRKSTRNDIDAYYIAATDIANELGNTLVANMIMLGAYVEITQGAFASKDAVYDSFSKILPGEKIAFREIDQMAFEKGRAIIQEMGSKK